MESEIRLLPGSDLDSAIKSLQAAEARGEHVFCRFNGHILHSEGITEDSAYIEVLGCTKEEHNKLVEELMEKYRTRNT